MKKARTPEEVHVLFEERFQSGDLDGLVALYEERAMIAPQADQMASGHDGIRDSLAGFLALNGKFTTSLRQALVTDDVALLYSSWSLEGTHPDGTPVTLNGLTSDVVRRQTDNTWLFVIDSPFGGGWK